ncbi:MAG: phosphoglycerate transporter [Dehalococcoidia bacterium]|nr:MAG: phosphoglycerate transporter [Dehalococcoidia bacterium]
MYRFGWFSTGRDKAARDLLETAYKAIDSGKIKAEIAFVFCSRESGESVDSDKFINLVKSYDIPVVLYSYNTFKADKDSFKHEDGLPEWRLEYERNVMRMLDSYHVDICILAGYMLIVGREMCKRYNMINLHPAAPGGPAGTWQEVIWQLMDNKTKETGVMMHLVTPELDKGPVVTYCTFSITGNMFDVYWQQLEGLDIGEIKKRQGENNRLFRLIRQNVLKRELPLIIATMKVFSQCKIKIINGQVIDSNGSVINGYNLTAEINDGLRAS